MRYPFLPCWYRRFGALNQFESLILVKGPRRLTEGLQLGEYLLKAWLPLELAGSFGKLPYSQFSRVSRGNRSFLLPCGLRSWSVGCQYRINSITASKLVTANLTQSKDLLPATILSPAWNSCSAIVSWTADKSCLRPARLPMIESQRAESMNPCCLIPPWLPLLSRLRPELN